MGKESVISIKIRSWMSESTSSEWGNEELQVIDSESHTQMYGYSSLLSYLILF